MQNDKYSWLRDPLWKAEGYEMKDEKILSFLNDENAKVESFFKPLENLKAKIFDELKGRIKEDDSTVPVKHGDFYYYTEMKSGQEYSVHIRKKSSLDANSEVILDENVEAKEYSFFKVKSAKVSHDHRYLAYSVDITGGERFVIYIKDLNSNLIIDRIENTFGVFEWDNNYGIYYIPANEFWRSDKILFHKLNSQQSEDALIYQEEDATYHLGIEKTLSDRFLIIDSHSGVDNEIHVIDLNSEAKKLSIIQKRRENHKYSLTHHDDYFYIITNDKGRNFRLVKALISSSNYESWEEVIAHDENVYLIEVAAYKKALVVVSKELGLNKISFYDYKKFERTDITFDQEVYYADHIHTDYEAEAVRYIYSALSTPHSYYEQNFEDGSKKLLKVTEIPSVFEPNEYEVRREFAISSDGVKVPISLLYKKSMFRKDGSNPLYLYGYGSYGISITPYFSSKIISLVDRGFVYAIAHIRGGDDLGYDWYESAKFLNKKRTFVDFIACAEHLIKSNYTKQGEIAICGGSAGGMLVGAAINMRPELFKAAVMHVPFVDVLNTMLDETLPLTPGEFKEWGNPKDPVFYEYIKSYCPYSNIKVQDYPHVFITAGLYDPRVTYWEPAKFLCKLREFKKDGNISLMKTNMSAGHTGKTGRFIHLEEFAEEFAFILKIFGLE